MSRQNYYAQRKRRQWEQVDGELVARLVRRERCVQPRLGGRKLRHVLNEELAEAGVELGRDRFFKILAEPDLLLEPQAAEYPCTGANQVWVSDITYLRTLEGFLYLALITDKWSRKIVGQHW
jgi:transposase InsO family protein